MFWKRISVSLLMFLGFPALTALAAPPPSPVSITEPVGTLQQFLNFACSASNWLFAFVMVIAIIILLLGAAKFFTAGGSEDQVATARKYITYALVGIAVAILARSLILVVSNFVGGAGSGGLFGC